MAKGRFETGLLDRKISYLLFGDGARGPGVRDEPECVRLDPEPGVAPSPEPPVRIFLGTEPEQYRAERVFVWSILQVRDPARAYEIHLMKELRGYDRSDWKTGFSRYRFAIPKLAGGRGRAIYNDVDQIYLCDPAELFDLDMGPYAALAIDQRETSVMLLDCERLAALWAFEGAEIPKKKHFRQAASAVWGPLDGAWNARDHEYRAGRSKLLHYSTLHTQPWQPFPRELRYRPNEHAEVWHALERSADAAGFTVFTRERPSRRFRELGELHRKRQEPAGPARDEADAALEEQVRESGADSLLGVSFGRDAGAGFAARLDLAEPASGAPGDERADGVVALGMLERLPEEDVPWAIRALFARAGRFVHAEVACDVSGEALGDDAALHGCVVEPERWAEEFRRTARLFPGIAWSLVCRQRSVLRGTRRYGKEAG